MHINYGRHVKDAVMRFKLLLPGCLQELEAAMDALGEVTGRTMREDITNRIFERFCVGK